MTEGHPVLNMPLLFSERPGMEAVLGASGAAALPAEPSLAHLNGLMPPAQIAMTFLIAFRQVMPAAAEQLFPGLYTPDGFLTARADSLLTDAANHCGPASSSAFSAILEEMVLDLMR